MFRIRFSQPRRFLLVANNDNPSPAELSCINAWQLSEERGDAVVRFNHLGNLNWFNGSTHLALHANREDMVHEQVAHGRLVAPSAVHAVFFAFYESYRPWYLRAAVRNFTPPLDGYILGTPGYFSRVAPELNGSRPSLGFAMMHILHRIYPDAEVLTAGFDFHRDQANYPWLQPHKYNSEREAASRLPWVRDICSALSTSRRSST